MTWLRAGVLVLAAALLAAGSLAATESSDLEQRIAVQPAVQDVAPGGIATLTLVYDTNDSTLAGLALRLHYDSSQLTLDGARLLYSFGAMGHQDQADAGSDYADQYDDGDPATDRRYLAAWSELSAAWPGNEVGLPLPLLELRFRVNGGFDVATLEVTGNACGGCRLVAQSAKVQAIAGVVPPPSSPTPSAPTATTTPTPSPETRGSAGGRRAGPLWDSARDARHPDAVGAGRPRLRRPAGRLRRPTPDSPSRLVPRQRPRAGGADGGGAGYNAVQLIH